MTWAVISAQLGVFFARLPFSPDVYTWSTLPTAFLGLVAIARHHIPAGVVLFAAAGILDVIDGALARTLEKTTYAGAFLDGSLDRFVDFFVIFSYFWLPMSVPWLPLGHWICITYFFAIMPSFEVAYANHRKAVDDPDEKLIWRILNRGEMYVLMLLIPIVSLHNPLWAGYLLVSLVALSAITTLQTLYLTLRLSTK